MIKGFGIRLLKDFAATGSRAWLKDREDALVGMSFAHAFKRGFDGCRMMSEIIEDRDTSSFGAQFHAPLDSSEAAQALC